MICIVILTKHVKFMLSNHKEPIYYSPLLLGPRANASMFSVGRGPDVFLDKKLSKSNIKKYNLI